MKKQFNNGGYMVIINRIRGNETNEGSAKNDSGMNVMHNRNKVLILKPLSKIHA